MLKLYPILLYFEIINIHNFSLCYKTFNHADWCEKKDEIARTLRCESCGGIIKGVRTPSPNGMVDDDQLTVISTPTEMELAIEVVGDQVSFVTMLDYEDDRLPIVVYASHNHRYCQSHYDNIHPSIAGTPCPLWAGIITPCPCYDSTLN